MQQANQSLAAKQRYLLSEILSNSYDRKEDQGIQFQNHFTEWLRKRGLIQESEVGEIQNVTMEQLKLIVQDFKSKKQVKKQQEPKEIEINSTKEIDMSLTDQSLGKSEENPKTRQQKPKLSQAPLNNAEFSFTLPIKKTLPFYDLTKNTQLTPLIFVKDLQIRYVGGFLGISRKTEYWVTVCTNFNRFVVKRSSQDFVFLRKILSQLFPFTFIPSLPAIPSQKKDMTVWMSSLQHFLSFFLQSPMLLENLYTYRFLTEQKPSLYAQHRQRAENACKIEEKMDSHQVWNKIINGQNIDGKIQGQISLFMQKRRMEAQIVAQVMNDNWNQINRQITQLEFNLKSVENQSLKLAKSLKALAQQLPSSQNSTCLPYKSAIQQISSLLEHSLDGNILIYTMLQQIQRKVTSTAPKQWNSFKKYLQEMEWDRCALKVEEMNANKNKARHKDEITNELDKSAEQIKIAENIVLEERQFKMVSQIFSEQEELPQKSANMQESPLTHFPPAIKILAYLNKSLYSSYQHLLNRENTRLRTAITNYLRGVLQTKQSKWEGRLSRILDE